MVKLADARERHMPRAIRSKVERSLRSYRAQRAALANISEMEAVLTGPTTAHMSQIGSQRMRKSDPTQGRAIKLDALHRRHGISAQVILNVRSIDRWLLSLGAEDAMLVRMTYGMDTSDEYTQAEIGAKMGISDREVRRRTHRLIWEAAAVLGHLRAVRVVRESGSVHGQVI